MTNKEFTDRAAKTMDRRYKAMRAVMAESALKLILELADRHENKLAPKKQHWSQIKQIADAVRGK